MTETQSPPTTSVVSLEFRCRGRVQGILKKYPNGKEFLEIRCIDKRCADRGEGEVVFHYFDIQTGKLDHTKKYRDPHRSESTSGKDESNTNNQ